MVESSWVAISVPLLLLDVLPPANLRTGIAICNYDDDASPLSP